MLKFVSRNDGGSATFEFRSMNPADVLSFALHLSVRDRSTVTVTRAGSPVAIVHS